MATDPAQGASKKEYSAKLFFQFRVGDQPHSRERRLCEERIVRFQARSGKEALAIAKRKGKAAQHSYRNSDGEPVQFEFIGVKDLLHLGLECEDDEVWYELIERLSPMERRDKLIPPDPILLSRL